MSTFAIAVPQQVGPDGRDAAAVRGYLQRAEALGFTGCWVSEQVVGTAPVLSPLEVLAVAAGCTERLRLGTAALISTVRSPLHLAHSVATLDHLSGGRVELGVATGGSRRPFPAYGATAAGYLQRFEEGIAVIDAAWRQDRVEFHGRFFSVDGLPVEPKPVQRPRPPLWLGGGHPDAVRRAVRLGDGFFGAGSATTEAFAGQVEVARTALRDAGRADAGFRIAKRVYIAVDDDPARARARIGAALDGAVRLVRPARRHPGRGVRDPGRLRRRPAGGPGRRGRAGVAGPDRRVPGAAGAVGRRGGPGRRRVISAAPPQQR
jgi:probable F420-dependent oxidoreductase